MTLEQCVCKAGVPLRLGFTTGTCAALAAGAAVRMLLTGKPELSAAVMTPAGIRVEADILDAAWSDREASCAVRKDAGDDPDVTNGILVQASVRRMDGVGVRVDGGDGVGRVTRRGLEQPVGAAAINRVPREMIRRAVIAACQEHGYGGGIAVTISVPDGERVAKRTFNPHLGIAGGLSIIGTSGIVEPMSVRAMVDALAVEMDVLRAEGGETLVLTPGNYGQDFVSSMPELSGLPRAKCSNHIGEALDLAVRKGFARMIVVGHLGKMIKLSGGVMDTHSRMADCRLELLALQAALNGAGAAALEEILDAATVDEGLAILDDLSLRSAVVAGILPRVDRYLGRRIGEKAKAGAVIFSNRFGLLGISAVAGAILKTMRESVNE